MFVSIKQAIYNMLEVLAEDYVTFLQNHASPCN